MLYKTFLSWDCAHKSLAYSYIRVNVEADKNNANDYIQVISMSVVDLLPGKKMADTDDMERIRALKKFLCEGPVATIEPGTTVLIERQPVGKFAPAANTLSTSVANCLAFYYADHDVKFVSPTKKNKVHFNHENAPASYETYEAKYKKKYDANKQHSKDNFLFVSRTFGLEPHWRHVDKACLDDLADSFMQILGYLKGVNK